MKRRQALKTIALSTSLAPLYSLAASNSEKLQTDAQLKVCIFSKHLQFLDYQETAETAAEIGFDGLDIPVRPKGHVLPEHVARDLPLAVAAAQKAGLTVPMMTTAIRGAANEPYTETILKTASALGIKHYRMGYLPYEESKGIAEKLKEYNKDMKALAKLNKKYDIQGAYQNHSGTRVGGPVWDIDALLKGVDPQWLGCQYDIRHATAEGGKSWPIGLKLLRPYVKNIVIKDFHWDKNDKGKWFIKDVPVGEGMVDFAAYLGMLKQYKFQGPISMHVEYHFHEHEEAVAEKRKKAIKSMKKDLQSLRKMLAEAGF